MFSSSCFFSVMLTSTLLWLTCDMNIQITGEEFVEKGDRIYLKCKATWAVQSPEDLDWFRNGNKLTTEFARKIYIRKFVSLTTRTTVSILEIKNAKLDDAGVYVCRTSDLQIASRRINVSKSCRGHRCRVNEDDCLNNLCANGSTCVEGLDGYTCQCPPTYEGKFCDIDVDECGVNPNICRNGATCMNQPGGYRCTCVNGWNGTDCSENINDCLPNPCYNGGTCRDRVGYFFCECPRGKIGLRCHLEDSCESNPCRAGTMCESSPSDGRHRCTCEPGWTGSSCDEDINECKESAEGPCKNGACQNTDGSFQCICLAGFTGQYCEVNILPDIQITGEEFVEKGERIYLICNATGIVQSPEDLDWFRNGNKLTTEFAGKVYIRKFVSLTTRTIVSILEIKNAKLDDAGVYVCRTSDLQIASRRINVSKSCRGHRCRVNEDDCLNNLCANGSTCVEGLDGYTCQCPPTNEGKFCDIDVDECGVNPNICRNGATCMNQPGGYRCTCVNGWNGTDCSENINDCLHNPCYNGGTCRDRVGYFFCECPKGKTGLRCHLEDSCESNPCRAGARCESSPSDGRHRCTCEPGWTGSSCDEDINECKESAEGPCENGECQNTDGNFQCICLACFTGTYCEVNIPRDIQITGEEFVVKGERIYLLCNATGIVQSPDDIDWLRNGNKLTTEFARKMYIRKFVSLTTRTIVSILEIKNAKLDDAGVYVCRTSDLQVTSHRIKILIA